MQVLGMEVPSLNPGKFFSTFLCTLFYPVVTTLLEYLNHAILYLFGYCYNFNCSRNSIAIQTIKRHCYNDQPLYTPIFKSFPYPYSVYPIAVTEV